MEPRSPIAIARALFGGALPTTVRALEEAIGVRVEPAHVATSNFGSLMMPAPLANAAPVSAVWGTYLWDMHHEAPPASVDALRARTLTSFTIVLEAGYAEIRAEMHERLGAPRELGEGKGSVFGAWILTAQGPGCVLEHHDKLPDRAAPPTDTAARERALADILALAASAADVGALGRAATVAPSSAGLVVSGGQARDQGIAIELVPPMLALDVARIAGWPDVVGRCYGIYQDDWQIHLLAIGSDGSATATLPVIGGWVARAWLERRPTGGAVASTGPLPPGGFHRVGANDLVRRLHIERSR